jgi:hypothetical protein
MFSKYLFLCPQQITPKLTGLDTLKSVPLVADGQLCVASTTESFLGQEQQKMDAHIVSLLYTTKSFFPNPPPHLHPPFIAHWPLT